MSEITTAPSERDPRHAALFAQLVLQQSNMALMLMGKAPDPESGQVAKDLQASGYFIDQLEMLEAKTRGNLSKQEADLLKQSLTTLRMAFVEAAEEAGPAEAKPPVSSGETQSANASPPSAADASPPASEPEDKRKFTKKY